MVFQSNETIKLEQSFNKYSLNDGDEDFIMESFDGDQPSDDNLSQTDSKYLKQTLPDHNKINALQTSNPINPLNQVKDNYVGLENDIQSLKTVEMSTRVEISYQKCENDELKSIYQRDSPEGSGLDQESFPTSLNDNTCILDPDIKC